MNELKVKSPQNGNFEDLNYLRLHMDGGKPNRYLLFLKRIVVLFFLTVAFYYSRGQTPYSVGTSFTTTFFNRGEKFGDSLNTYSFFLYSEFLTCGTLSVPGQGTLIPFRIEPDSSIQLSLSLPKQFSNIQMQDQWNNSIIIEAQRPIAVISGINVGKEIADSSNLSISNISGNNEASSLIPDKFLSHQYFDISLNGEFDHTSNYTASFIQIATRKFNKVDFSLSTNSYDRSWLLGENHKFLNGRRNLDSIILQAFQSTGFFISSIDSLPPYTVTNPSFNNSIGSFYKGSTLFSVMSSSISQTDSILSSGGGGLGFEQLPPINYSSRSFVFPRLEGYKRNIFTILSLSDSNRISINGSAVFILDSLESMSDAINKDVEITSTGNLMMVGGNSLSDSIYRKIPIVINILPKDNLIQRGYCKAIESFDTTVSYYLTLICPTQNQNSFTLDGQMITPTFTSFSHTPGWSYTQIKVKKGDHVVENPLGFQGYLYSPWKYSGVPIVTYGINLISLDSNTLDPNKYSFKASKKGTYPILFSDFTDSLCPGEDLLIHLPDVSHTEWNIDWGDGSSVQVSVEDSIPGPVSHAYSMTGPYTIYVNDISGCEEPDSLLVYVREGELPDFYGEIISTCEGRFFMGQVNVASSQVGWAFSTGDSIVGNPIKYHIPETGANALMVTVFVRDGECLVSNSGIYPLDDNNVFPDGFPNVFTPNNDGVNDCFPSKTLPANNCYSLSIFNRWGQEVFSTDRTNRCWDGNLQNGNPASEGTYFFILKWNGMTLKKSAELLR
ncbi:MAG: gliding motility-associated C-terminal domain-containing protein [Bacteroidota bacterium]|nr:gliding motility-associated C-terminal domain-containing protein [Bacteroidota bacterium]